MCELGKGIRNGSLHGVLYADSTQASKDLQEMLESVGAKYELADAATESLQEPILVVDGSFFDAESLREILKV